MERPLAFLAGLAGVIILYGLTTPWFLPRFWAAALVWELDFQISLYQARAAVQAGVRPWQVKDLKDLALLMKGRPAC